MLKINHIIIFVGLIVLASLPKAEAHSYSKAFFFGDSLSDTGNACPRGKKTSNRLCPLYPGERFTNHDGLVWSELFAARLDFALKPSLIGGDNFAFGGATSGKGTRNTPGVTAQIDSYLKRNGGFADPDALYVIWVGGNDIKNSGLPLDLLENVRNAVETLADHGAQHFIVPNLPPIHETPIANHLMSGASYVVTQVWNWFAEEENRTEYIDIKSILSPVVESGISIYNHLLDDALHEVSRDFSVNICKPDVFALFQKVSENPKKYGFNKAGDLFCFDFFHPSADAHKIIANAIFNECVAAQ